MPFFIDGNPTPSEISDAVNYLLANSQQTTSTNIVNGQVTDAAGTIVSYLYKYIYVKYADSFDGTVNFSNTPTGRSYYGLRNNDSATESTNPADYIWYQVAGGFGTTKFVFYSITGGRRINIVVGLSAPSILYQADSGAAINLDQISGSDGASSRICYAKSTSTSLASTPTTYQTSGPSGFPPTNTWGGAETWQATPPTLAVNEALFQSDGIYNPVSDLTTWNVPYLSNLKVGSLSAISANLGSVTAGELIISGSGGTPTISGTTMTGTGTHLYNDGRFALGNSSGNIVYDGTKVSLNGFATALTAYNAGANVPATGNITLFTFTIAKAGNVMLNLNTYLSAAFGTSCAGAQLIIGIAVKNSSGTLVSVAENLSLVGTPIVNMTLPTYKIIGSSVSFNQVISLTADTYTVSASRSSQTDAFDSVGNSVAITYISLQNIVASAYQVIA
jgi:hypothetical protein